MTSKNNQVLKKDTTTNRTFAYSKGNVSLSFTLRTDIKQELKDFQECLGAAQEDVKAQLESMK